MRRHKDVSNRSVSFTYQSRRCDDVSAWSATSQPIWDLNEMSLRRRMPGGKLPFVVLQRNTKFHSCTQTVIRSSFTTKCKILKLYPNSYSFFTTKYTILKVAPKWLFVFPTKKCKNLLFIINLTSFLKNRKKKWFRDIFFCFFTMKHEIRNIIEPWINYIYSQKVLQKYRLYKTRHQSLQRFPQTSGLLQEKPL